MGARQPRTDLLATPRAAWLARLVVLSALALTLWLAGPRAMHVLQARVGSHAPDPGGPAVALDRVALAGAPSWLRGPLFREFLARVEPALRGEVGLLDDAGARALEQRLQATGWVRRTRLERRFPDGLRVQLEPRRPVLAVHVDDAMVALVDADGVAMPPVLAREEVEALPVPRTVLPGAAHLARRGAVRPGEPFPDRRVLAAAAVAVEWRDQVATAVADAPRLVEVDASNLGWRWVADPMASEVLVGVACADGADAFLQYGRAAAQGGAVPPETKIEVLRGMLELHPGLAGLRGGDLRLRNRWRDCLLARP